MGLIWKSVVRSKSTHSTTQRNFDDKDMSGRSSASPLESQEAVSTNKVVSPEMCFYCFDVLVSQLGTRNGEFRPVVSGEHFKTYEFPLFVTWKIGREKRLRGCMGTFSAKKLHKGLAEYSITSSMKDSRFKPISPEELPSLSCGVSLLTDFEPCDHYQDWVVGVHGIQIEFPMKGRTKTATYLPEVAQEQGWTKVQALDSLLRKGGYSELITEHFRSQCVRVTRYRTEKCTVTYEEYMRRFRLRSS